MVHRVVDASDFIAYDPKALIDYIANVRNRLQYIDNLKSLNETGGKPGEIGHSWEWTFEALGREFSGTARATEYVPGERYGFETKGGLTSQWSYKAEAKDGGTQLSVHVEYDAPDEIVQSLPPGTDPDALEQKQAAQMFTNLRKTLGV